MFYLKDETGKVLVNSTGAKIDIPLDNEFKSSLGRDPPDSVKRFVKTQNVNYEGMIFGMNYTMRYRERFIETSDKLYIMGTAADNPYVEDASAEMGVEDVIIQKGRYDKYYYISDKTERALLSFLKGQVYCGLILGPIFIILGLITFIL